MQIRDDQDPLSETIPSRRRETTPIQRLAHRNPVDDETLRLPLSAVALWRGSVDPRLETIQVQLTLPENLDDEDTLSLYPKKKRQTG